MSLSRLIAATEGIALGHRNVTMIIGLILALAMSGLLVWLNLNEGSGLVGLLLVFGVAAGLIVVLAGALSVIWPVPSPATYASCGSRKAVPLARFDRTEG